MGWFCRAATYTEARINPSTSTLGRMTNLCGDLPFADCFVPGGMEMRGDIRRIAAMWVGSALAGLATAPSSNQPTVPDRVVQQEAPLRNPTVYIDAYVTGYSIRHEHLRSSKCRRVSSDASPRDDGRDQREGVHLRRSNGGQVPGSLRHQLRPGQAVPISGCWLDQRKNSIGLGDLLPTQAIANGASRVCGLTPRRLKFMYA